ncbi:MAG: hypothetical protein H6837_13500 [Planctomycetes bacterium]|nr:hypothetical protein [Planctomycetota bacterium]
MHVPLPPIRASWFALVLAASSTTLAAAPQLDPIGADLESAQKRYKACLARRPFNFHTEARGRLARTREPEALKILLRDYSKPKEEKLGARPDRPIYLASKRHAPSYRHYARYTIATLLAQNFDSWTWDDKIAELRANSTTPTDAWLWACTVGADSRPEGTAKAINSIKSNLAMHLRAAAVEGLARHGNPEVLTVVPELCTTVAALKDRGERRMLVGALSSAIFAHKELLKDEQMKKAIRAYIGLLAADVKLSHSTKMVIARHLSKTIGKDALYIEPEPWLRLLEQNFTPPKRTEHTVSSMRFFGIEAEGDRLCYLVDMSNSMLKEIDPALQKKGPVTGPRRKRKPGQMPTEDDIPWHLVKTRFDLAREHLKISMQRLAKGKRFCVIWFGDEAGLFKSTPGMIPATYGNVKKVIAELDAIKPAAFNSPGWPKGKAASIAPNGWLRGDTNMHAGLRLAFAMRAKGFAPDNEHVDLKALAEGCDTIFLLSDGAPSMDDFYIEDKDYGEGKVVYDHEQKKEAPRRERLWYHGPYDQSQWLRADVDRMNVFRKVQVHCVGIGEADLGLLRGIASATMGQVHLVGAKAKAAGGKK